MVPSLPASSFRLALSEVEGLQARPQYPGPFVAVWIRTRYMWTVM